VDLIAYLFAFVSEDGVRPAPNSAMHDVGQVAVQLHGGMLQTGQAAAAEDAHRHLKVPAEFLAHHVGGHFRGAEDGMQARIY
jgi:hypothetical protein